ncbi:MAG: hypothetical protein GX664_05055 [Bacteroidales bacterium]|nr:hypothetical protein [Bacteroidales bacterium]
MRDKILDISARDIIKDYGMKATPQRIVVYEAMKDLCHASPEEVYQSVLEVMPSITIATIYNVLDTFCEKGILAKRMSPESIMTFDLVPEEHCHMYDCVNKKLLDYPDYSLNEIVRQRFHMRGYNLNGVEITFKVHPAKKGRHQ